MPNPGMPPPRAVHDPYDYQGWAQQEEERAKQAAQGQPSQGQAAQGQAAEGQPSQGQAPTQEKSWWQFGGRRSRRSRRSRKSRKSKRSKSRRR
jgi:hypothetical protein